MLFLCFLMMLTGHGTNDPFTELHQNGLVITEIMADPTPSFGLPEAEYVEIFNSSAAPINLTDYMLNDGSSKAISALTIDPGEYVIVCDDEDTTAFTSIGKVAWVSSLSLTNGGEPVVLYGPGGLVVDSLHYSSDWYGGSFKEDGGWSLERVDNNFHCHNDGNWKPSVNITGGTPAAANSVAGTFFDTDAPSALSAYPLSDSMVVVRFSEQFEPIAISQLSGTFPGTVLHAEYFLQKKDELLVLLSGQLSPANIYAMLFQDVADCAGNTGKTDTVWFGIPSRSEDNRVRINEILYDPETDCPEFIELINVSDSIADLSDYEICRIDPTGGHIESVHEISEAPFLIFPGEPVYISEDIRRVGECYNARFPEGAVSVSDLPSLVNSGGRLGLMYMGKLIDDVHFDDQMHHPLLFSTQGVSLELIDAWEHEFIAANWMSASSGSGYGTPGYSNSQSPYDITSEDWLSAVPVAFTPDNDGYDDFTSVLISSEESGSIAQVAIFDLTGQQVRLFTSFSLNAGMNRVIWSGENEERKMLPAGPYIVHALVIDHNGKKKAGKVLTVISE